MGEEIGQALWYPQSIAVSTRGTARADIARTLGVAFAAPDQSWPTEKSGTEGDEMHFALWVFPS
jgi:hypothetical protein